MYQKKRKETETKEKTMHKNSDIIQNKHRSHYKWVLHYMYIMNNV